MRSLKEKYRTEEINKIALIAHHLRLKDKPNDPRYPKFFEQLSKCEQDDNLIEYGAKAENFYLQKKSVFKSENATPQSSVSPLFFRVIFANVLDNILTKLTKKYSESECNEIAKIAYNLKEFNDPVPSYPSYFQSFGRYALVDTLIKYGQRAEEIYSNSKENMNKKNILENSSLLNNFK